MHISDHTVAAVHTFFQGLHPYRHTFRYIVPGLSHYYRGSFGYTETTEVILIVRFHTIVWGNTDSLISHHSRANFFFIEKNDISPVTSLPVLQHYVPPLKLLICFMSNSRNNPCCAV